MNHSIAILISGSHHYDNITQILQERGDDYPVYQVTGHPKSRDGIAKAKELQQQGIQVIISAGMNAVNIMSNLEIPVVCIQRSRLSMALTLKEALSTVEGDSKQIALVCSSGLFLEAARKAKEVFEANIRISIYNENDDLSEILSGLRYQGVELIIGPSTVLGEARALGMKTVSVPLEKSDILTAIQQAEQRLQFVLDNEQQIEIIRIIQDSTPYGIMATDREDNLLEINHVALSLFGVERSQVLGINIYHTLFSMPRIKRQLLQVKEENDQIIRIGDEQVVVHIDPILTGTAVNAYVYTFKRVSQIQKEETAIRSKLHKKGSIAAGSFEGIIGESTAIQNAIRTAKRFSSVNSTVLIHGQTGCGKELFAQSIHNYSSRSRYPFVVINCAALPETILESILFGYEPGAFTGAKNEGKQGLFEIAHNGTVFLDEISEMPLNTQARFLRVLQEKEVMRVGSDKAIPVDIRVIAASNKDLAQLVVGNQFREDLFYRINVLVLNVPPLCDRGDDVRLLIEYFLKTKSAELGLPVAGIDEEAVEYLMRLPLPGNIRQLSNIVEAAIVLSDSDRISLHTVRFVLGQSALHYGGGRPSHGLEHAEAQELRSALQKHDYHREKTAAYLNISKSTLWRKMKKYSLENSDL